MNILSNLSVLVGSSGLEPPTSRLSGARSNHLSYEPIKLSTGVSLSSLAYGGDDGIRTHDPLLAGQVLSQLSYTPIPWGFSSSLEFPFGHSKLNNKRVILASVTLLDLSSVVILLYEYETSQTPFADLMFSIERR